MKEHEKLLGDAVRLYRLTDKFEKPMIGGKRITDEEYRELMKFSYTLGESMSNAAEKRERPLTKDELAMMCLSSAKWALEELTTRKPALRKEI